MPIITFSTGIKKKYYKSVFLKKIVKDISKKTHIKYIAGYVNDILVNLDFLITKDVNVILISENDKIFLKKIRISCMQLLNYAVTELWPQIKKTNGVLTEDGFYCDFDSSEFFLKKEDLLLITKKMIFLLSQKYNIFFKKVSKKKFLKKLDERQEMYQSILIKENISLSDKIFVYFHQNYSEECHELQVSNIYFCKNFFLKDISGAYWKNDSKNKMLQRIHVVVWSSSNMLLKYKQKLLKLEKRDHRKLSKRLDLYHIQKDSPGMVFWHPNGYILFRQLENFIRVQLLKFSYQEVKSPFILNKTLWEKSGHLENFKKSIFITQSEHQIYCIKPMNCPGHVEIFKKKIRTYKDLPLRMSEFGSCHRKEPSGALHGLMRVRNFTQDDAHIFCRRTQIKKELNNCIDLILNTYKIFGFKKISIKFSTRPKKSIGNTILWNQAENDLKCVLMEKKIFFEIQKGEGAFYGPKIEISLEDSLQRIWQCGTIQLDFNLSKRLNAFYINKNNVRIAPIIIHRAILGSMERFIGILIEEYQGKFPLWLSPIQLVVLIISTKHKEYAKKFCKKCTFYGIRYIFDTSKINLNLKIKKYVMQYIPYIVIFGDKEILNNLITIRKRESSVLYTKKIKVFLKELSEKIITYDRS
ncbi:threonine--tRNA ligase [Buchnera aphidicola]|uniref:threonine--tRNA ligase n=1 Tax=Buchnera aphidicola TaxID=9 RepID=UPI0031B6D3F2